MSNPSPSPAAGLLTRTALVFEGGGMRAAYTSAVVVGLLEAGIDFGWVGGISAGSTNTVNYVARDGARARRSFVEFVADPRFGNLRTFVRGRGLYHAEYIYQVAGLPGGALPLDWETFTANPAQARIGGFHCGTGEQVYWGRADYRQLGDLLVRVRASSSMPVLMPIVWIDGEPFLDGALGPTGGFAVDAAEADGYDRFLVVCTQPRGFRKPPLGNAALLRRYFRRHPRVAEALLGRHERYNASLDRLADLECQGRAYLFVPETMPVRNGERNVHRLAAAHDLGLAQFRRELPAIRRFLGLAPGAGQEVRTTKD